MRFMEEDGELAHGDGKGGQDIGFWVLERLYDCLGGEISAA